MSFIAAYSLILCQTLQYFSLAQGCCFLVWFSSIISLKYFTPDTKMQAFLDCVLQKESWNV